METIRIKGLITRDEYIKVSLLRFVRHWNFRLILIIGCYFLFITIWKFIVNAPDKYSRELEGAIGFLIVIPMFLYYRLLKSYNSSKPISPDSMYEIDEDSIKFIGSSYSFMVKWEQLYKIEIIRKWIIIYQNEKEAKVIPTNNLDESTFNSLLKYIRANAVVWQIKFKFNNT